MAAVRLQAPKGGQKADITVGGDTDYDASTAVTLIVDPAVFTRRGEVIKQLDNLKAMLLERDWP